MGYDSNFKNAYVKFNIADIKNLCEQALKNLDIAVNKEFQLKVSHLVSQRLREANNPSILVRLGLKQRVEAITREEAEEILEDSRVVLQDRYNALITKCRNLKTAVENAPYQKMFIDADLYSVIKSWADKSPDGVITPY